MQICTKCKAVAPDGVCPMCDKRKFITEASDDDLVILTSSDYVTSFCIEDILNEAGVKYLKKGVLGSALTVTIGEFSESYNFYVLAKDYDATLPLIPDFSDSELDEEFDTEEE